MTKTNEKEELFCRMFVACRNTKEAAIKAGFTSHPEITGLLLMAKKNIRKTIERLENETKISSDEVRAGLRRIAFASSADAVRLLLTDDTSAIDIDSLDLFNVSEIKRAKGGGIEVKVFDRIKALEKLGEISGNRKSEEPSSFYAALENGASALGGGVIK